MMTGALLRPTKVAMAFSCGRRNDVRVESHVFPVRSVIVEDQIRRGVQN
jgi:hypothetical protein